MKNSEKNNSLPLVGRAREGGAEGSSPPPNLPHQGGGILTLSQILALPLLLLVLLYQKTLSPDHGMLKLWFPVGFCKFYPSCSEYTRIVLRKQGLLGIPKIIKRLLNCRPGVAPAIDKP